MTKTNAKTMPDLKPFICAVTFTKNDGTRTFTSLRHGVVHAHSEQEALGILITKEQPEGYGWLLQCKSVFEWEQTRTPDAMIEEENSDG